jgi:hypothetical protein
MSLPYTHRDWASWKRTCANAPCCGDDVAAYCEDGHCSCDGSDCICPASGDCDMQLEVRYEHAKHEESCAPRLDYRGRESTCHCDPDR